MAKLKNIKPQVATIKPLIGRSAGDEKARLRERDQNAPWRRWYKKARWAKLRWEILMRDGYTCQQTGELCIGKYPSPSSPVVDHIRPHRGDERLFWDRENLQCVSKAYHDSEKQKLERAMLTQAEKT